MSLLLAEYWAYHNVQAFPSFWELLSIKINDLGLIISSFISVRWREIHVFLIILIITWDWERLQHGNYFDYWLQSFYYTSLLHIFETQSWNISWISPCTLSKDWSSPSAHTNPPVVNLLQNPLSYWLWNWLELWEDILCFLNRHFPYLFHAQTHYKKEKEMQANLLCLT